MSLWESMADAPWAICLGQVLTHFVWQGAAVGLALALVLRLLRNHGAPARYAAACGAMVLMAALPLLTLGALSIGEEQMAPAVPTNGSAITLNELSSGGVAEGEPPPGDGRQFNMTRGASFGRLAWSPYVAFCWLVGVTVLSLRLLGGWAHVQRLRRRLVESVEERWRIVAAELSERLGISRTVGLLQSPFATSPLTLGWLRPVVILPARALVDLAPEQLKSILAHELAHVRRHDFLVNLLQSLLETLLFYHPAVWWASHRARVEREYCCDDVAVALCGDVGTYARALARLEEARQEASPRLAAAALPGGGLLRRVQRLVAPASPVERRAWLPGALAGGLVLCGVAAGMGASYAGARETAMTAPRRASVAATRPEGATPVVPARTETPGPDSDLGGRRQGPGAIAFLPIETEAKGEGTGEAGAWLHALVSGLLVNSEGVTMVERERLATVVGELRLSEGGMTSAPGAAQLGRLTGASSYVTAKLTEAGGERILSVRITDTETGELSVFQVSSSVDDGLPALAEAAAHAIAEALPEHASRLPAPDGERPYADELRALKRRMPGAALPRVAVLVAETHLGEQAVDPACDNELTSVLLELGFPVVDARGLESVAAPRGRISKGELARLKERADILIVGEAFSEYVGETHGFRSCRGRVEVKALDLGTETVAAADSRHASAADLGEFVAGKKALRLAGGEVGLAMAERLADYWTQNHEVGAGGT